jgi:hypothetical protein
MICACLAVVWDRTPGNRLRRRDLRVKKYGGPSGGKRGGHIQFEAGKFLIVQECRVCFAQILTMVQRQRSDGAALRGDLLETA